MKEKEPNELFFSADDSPVPLPSVEDAWSDMRKKLDDEMQERAAFFIWRRAGLLLGLLLLSLGLFWYVGRRRTGVRPMQGTVANQMVTDSKITPVQPLKERADKQQREVVGRQQREVVGRQQTGKVNEATQNAPAGQRISNTAINTTVNRRNIGAGTTDAKRSIIDERLLLTGNHDPINILATVRRKPSATPGKLAGTDKAAATTKPKAERPKKIITGDSTRILWAAGLQDSKSFPVGAQQPVDYNANLKKDLWFDYIPSPYFQYFISKRIGFQIGVQFNSPQYTENVSIYKGIANGSGSGLFVNDTVLVVKKLYYLSLPLTVYYSPIRNLYLGAGLQYSNLRNGVAFQNNVVHYTGSGPGQRDTVTFAKAISLKDYAPAYSNLKRTDWRALFEMDYYWKRLTLGVQYQQGLGDYLYTPVDGSTGKDRNSSFNVYLRYNIWERRIRIATR